jgi:hypothetical protein
MRIGATSVVPFNTEGVNMLTRQLILFISLFLLARAPIHAQEDINTWLAELESADPTTRQAGFYAIVKAKATSSSDAVKLGLINLLLLEEGYVKQRVNLSSELYGDYFRDVVITVASLHDSRSTDGLIGVIQTGNAVADALASFGSPALDKVISSLNSTDVLTRFGSVKVLGKMIVSGTVTDATSLAKIQAALDSASLDPDYNTGLTGIQALLRLFHVPTTGVPIRVQIDIKPGSFPNALNPRSNGVVPVAILSSSSFDATTVDTSSARFGPGQAPAAHGTDVEDVDGDGLKDVVLHFDTQAAGISCSDIASFLIAKTAAGKTVVGSDSVLAVGCK